MMMRIMLLPISMMTTAIMPCDVKRGQKNESAGRRVEMS
jgi:hypothetical protein